jgi:transposase
MTKSELPVNRTICQIREVQYTLPLASCDRCQRPVASFSTANRTAIDLHLEHPVLLQITVSVHYCSACQHYFRAQPPFLRRDAIYTNQVIDKAVQSVYEDAMAMRQVTARMARDFWVQPSEGIIRQWCRDYGAGFDFETDYQPWVVQEFSGVLCVDEIYQDRLALLLAVDPAGPDGDRWVGYQLVHGSITACDVECFLARLKSAGIEPSQVVTDGSSLYPAVLTKVWPQAAHQLCLFHETRRLTRAAMKAINAVRKRLPHPPPTSGTRGGGPMRGQPPSDDPTDPATHRWYWRQMRRRARIACVHELADQGLSQRAIARQTGHHRNSVARWLKEPLPSLPEGMPEELCETGSLPVPLQRKESERQMKQQVHALVRQGLSHSAIARPIGIHRLTVKSWLQQEPPTAQEEPPTQSANPSESIRPPEPWPSWDEVRRVREALTEHRFLLLRRSGTFTMEEQKRLASLLASPVGPELRLVRSFLMDWYSLWTDENGQRRSLPGAQNRFETWRNNTVYSVVPQLRRVQGHMTSTKFEDLSQFLRHPDWEATNIGAERGGRAFRHRQAPHFNLRKKESIENAINELACSRKKTAEKPSGHPIHTCQRGRRGCYG